MSYIGASGADYSSSSSDDETNSDVVDHNNAFFNSFFGVNRIPANMVTIGDALNHRIP